MYFKNIRSAGYLRTDAAHKLSLNYTKLSRRSNRISNWLPFTRFTHCAVQLKQFIFASSCVFYGHHVFFSPFARCVCSAAGALATYDPKTDLNQPSYQFFFVKICVCSLPSFEFHVFEVFKYLSV